MKNLWLNNNRLKEFNVSLLDGLSFENLNLSYNKLTEFDAKSFYNVTNLDLTFNLIERLLNLNFSKISKDETQNRRLLLLKTLNLNKNNLNHFLNDTEFPLVSVIVTTLDLILSNNNLTEFGEKLLYKSNKNDL